MAVSTFRAHCSISHPRIDFAGAEGAAALAAHIKTCKPPVNPHYSKAYNSRLLSQRLPAHTLPSARPYPGAYKDLGQVIAAQTEGPSRLTRPS